MTETTFARTGAPSERSGGRSGVTAPDGFRAAGISAGIKPAHGLDLALVVSDRPARAAAVFTTNQIGRAHV